MKIWNYSLLTSSRQARRYTIDTLGYGKRSEIGNNLYEKKKRTKSCDILPVHGLKLFSRVVVDRRALLATAVRELQLHRAPASSGARKASRAIDRSILPSRPTATIRRRGGRFIRRPRSTRATNEPEITDCRCAAIVSPACAIGNPSARILLAASYRTLSRTLSTTNLPTLTRQLGKCY